MRITKEIYMPCFTSAFTLSPYQNLGKKKKLLTQPKKKYKYRFDNFINWEITMRFYGYSQENTIIREAADVLTDKNRNLITLNIKNDK